MRTSLVIFGVIFLVIGGLFYFMPSQTAKATTTTVGAVTTDTRTSYATVSVPLPVTYAVLAIGLILSVLGFALPGPRPSTKQQTPVGPATSESSTTETKEDSETNDETGRKVVHTRHVQHTQTK